MANEHVQIHDPFSNHNGLSDGVADCDQKPTSDPDSMEDTLEFRLLMAYAKRRRPRKSSPARDGPTIGGTDSNGSAAQPQTPAQTEPQPKKKKKKKGWRRLPGIFMCISSKTTDGDEPIQNTATPPDVHDRCGDFKPVVKEEEEEEDELSTLASRLTKIADEIPFVPPDLEADTYEDLDANVAKVIGLLLRETGDRVYEQELKNANITAELFWNYSFFKLLMTTLLLRMGLRSPNPDSPGPKASPKTQIAVMCEATSRLSAVSTLPRTRLLHHGARYLQHYYSSWAQQQGGYEEAFYSDDEDDIQ